MVGTLKTRSAKGEAVVLLPGSTEAEPWEAWTTGPQARCLQAHPKLDDHARPDQAVLALPAAQVVALPLWLQETDPKQFRGLIPLQLEAHGLQGRAVEPVFEWSPVVEEEKQSLVLVGVLATDLPEELENGAYRGFEVSPRCFALPADALVFWLEQGRLVLAITRGERLAYFQALSEATFSTRVVQDVACVLAALGLQKVIGSLREIVLWSEAGSLDSAQLQLQVGLPVRREDKPAPSLPREKWSLTPGRVSEVNRDRARRRWLVRVIGLALLLILLVAGGLGLRLYLVSRDIAQLQQWQAAHASALSTVQDTRSAWRDLQPVVDTKAYPLEILLNVAKALPGEQAHLTLFEASGDHVLIKAEAKNLTAAFQFFDALKKNPQLAAYGWEMAQPHSLANDITQIQVEGTHAPGH